MRFSGDRQVPAPADVVWASLHDADVLCAVVPGCTEVQLLEDGRYSARLEARVGRLADVYRGTFTVTDLRGGSELRVRVRASGRFGRLDVDLDVILTDGSAPGTTALRYDAEAVVGGVVSRLGTPALTVTGGHFTGCFFRGLERWALSSRRGRGSRRSPEDRGQSCRSHRSAAASSGTSTSVSSRTSSTSSCG